MVSVIIFAIAYSTSELFQGAFRFNREFVTPPKPEAVDEVVIEADADESITADLEDKKMPEFTGIDIAPKIADTAELAVSDIEKDDKPAEDDIVDEPLISNILLSKETYNPAQADLTVTFLVSGTSGSHNEVSASIFRNNDPTFIKDYFAYPELKNVSNGKHSFTWDGDSNLGATGLDGKYTLRLAIKENNKWYTAEPVEFNLRRSAQVHHLKLNKDTYYATSGPLTATFELLGSGGDNTINVELWCDDTSVTSANDEIDRIFVGYLLNESDLDNGLIEATWDGEDLVEQEQTDCTITASGTEIGGEINQSLGVIEADFTFIPISS